MPAVATPSPTQHLLPTYPLQQHRLLKQLPLRKLLLKLLPLRKLLLKKLLLKKLPLSKLLLEALVKS